MSEDVGEQAPGRSVLVVEDDQAIGNMLVTLLTAEGYAPTLVADGQAALDVARRQRPALVTLDLALPGMDGLEVLRQLDALDGGRVPVVIISAFTGRLTPDQRARAAAVLTKPFDIDTLLSCISMALRGP